MSNLIKHKLGRVTVEQQATDGYINATKLSKAYLETTGTRREPADWLRQKRVKDTLSHLSETTGIPVENLIHTIEGRSGGTYIHPRLSVRFAIWLSDDFGFAVEEWVEQWSNSKGDPNAYLKWQKSRIEGKDARRDLTDAIKAYVDRHPEMSANARKWVYKNATDKMYKQTHGRQAKKLVEALGCDKTLLRDSLTRKELTTLHSVEDTATRLIDDMDINPSDAIVEATERVLAVGRFTTLHLPQAS